MNIDEAFVSAAPCLETRNGIALVSSISGDLKYVVPRAAWRQELVVIEGRQEQPVLPWQIGLFMASRTGSIELQNAAMGWRAEKDGFGELPWTRRVASS